MENLEICIFEGISGKEEIMMKLVRLCRLFGRNGPIPLPGTRLQQS
jgi:hypothetical protein